MPTNFLMIAKTFFGLEGVLAQELAELGAADITQGRRMVAFNGDRRLLFRANLWCRTAVRILKPIHSFEVDPAASEPEQELYRSLQVLDWSEHLDADGTLAIDPVASGQVFKNSLYAAQVAKDAIVDQFRARTGRRPDIDRDEPDLRINLHLSGNRVTVYLDASGQSLHKRGYRTAGGDAPINEVLAAGILRLTGWNADVPLADFMCGSGTFPIEAALIARRIAPGLVRKKFGYMRWKDFDRQLHAELMAEAQAQILPSCPALLQASDIDSQVLQLARENAKAAGVDQDISWHVENFESARPRQPGGILVSNPPYDERLKADHITAVYRRIGDALKQNWDGYTAFIFSGNLEASRQIGLRTSSKIKLFNGPIECRLLSFPLYKRVPTAAAVSNAIAEVTAGPTEVAEYSGPRSRRQTWQDQTAVFRSRLERMGKHWAKWARRQGITSYQVYDRDIPEIPLTIDRYEDNLLIGEHERPHEHTDAEHQVWLDEMAAVAADVLGVAPDRTVVQPRRGEGSLAGRAARRPRTIEARESGLRLLATLGPDCDCGLPLDQRTIREMLHKEAAGKRFLNLFGYTGTATVFAAAGGALSTTTVDFSAANLQTATKNLEINKLAGPDHRLVQQDVRAFLQRLAPDELFDLSCACPPTVFEGYWNIEHDHVEMLNLAIAHLVPGGKLYFATTSRRFKLRDAEIVGATTREISRQTVPPDFRNRRVHRCWTFIRT